MVALAERSVAYNITFDINRAKEIELSKKEAFVAYTEKQLITHLGERLSVVLSKGRLDIKEGMLCGENADRSMLSMIVSGRDFRRKYGNPVDFEREDAELLGFRKIEQILADPNTEIGSMILSVSPRGGERSDYKHNFYDVFTLKEDEEGRFVESRRYSSALSAEESVQRLGEITPVDTLLSADDVSLLANPILIENRDIKNAEDLHKILHKDHEVMDEEEFERVMMLNRPYREAYLDALSRDDPDLPYYFNAILINADQLAGKTSQDGSKTIYLFQPDTLAKKDIVELGKQEVRQVNTGCGSSGGALENSPYSASNFALSIYGQDEFGNLAFACPKCGHVNIRPKGEMIAACQHCNSSEVSCGGSWE